MQIQDVLDMSLLQEHIDNGFISARQHNEFPLTILNYTPMCQFSRGWDEVTLQCRGMIYNHDTGELLARPFSKFMNWDESGQPYPPSGPVLRMEKLDGSLGILYTYEDRTGCVRRIEDSIATRGSFHSEQAEWATKFYNDLDFDPFPKKDKTYLFEIIYPENRIVVDYGQFRGLVLLDVIDNATGNSDGDEFDDFEWPEKVVRVPMPGFDSGQVVDIPAGGEGFVFLWPTRGFRTKMKSAEYIEIHKIVTGLSTKTIWEALCAGKTVEQIKVNVPEEFHVWIDEEAEKIQTDAADILTAVYHAIDLIEYDAGRRMDMMLRSEFAEYAKKYGHLAKYLFMVLDGKPIYPVALRESKPDRTLPVVEEV